MRRFSGELRRSAEPARGLGTALLLVAVFSLLALVIRVIALHVDQAPTPMFWPANGALVVAMLILPRGACIFALVLCFCANILLNLFSLYTNFDNVLFSTLNILVSYVVAVLTRWLCGATTDLSRLSRLAMFVPIVFLSTAAEAAIGEVISPPSRPIFGVLHDWMQWSLCDGLGLLLATPAILLPLKNYHNEDRYAASVAERWALLLGGASLTFMAFLNPNDPLFLLIFPVLVLTAFRAGPAWVQASILISAIISSGLTAHDYGPLSSLSQGNVLRAQDLLQVFLIAIFFTSVPATNALGEKSRATRRLLHMKSQMEHGATHDALTGLVNRSLFKRRLKALLDSGATCAVLFVDLDRFKHVNDTMGHQAGDALLKSFSERLLEVAGTTMLASRFGGDEFAVLVHGPIHEADQEKLCRRINDVARIPFPLDRGTAYVTASVGLAVATGAGAAIDVSEVMRRADIALYAVKAAGRDSWRIFSDDLARSADERASIEADLRMALQSEGQLQLHYQAKVDPDHTIKGVEALLRWHHPTRGWVPPNQVIPVAEETGLIIPLGDWILREALSFAARWPQLNVAVNVSPLQLRHPRFVADLLAAYHAAQVSFGRLELEVTETALMDDINVVSGRLATLRAEGIRVALDDFGTGYSSLRHLHRCGVDRVKIDQSFVQGLDSSNEAAAIIKAIIKLGHAMDLQVTAEGVETDTQHRFLLEAGADELQGYLFSKPVEEAAFVKLMHEWRSAAAPREYAVLNGELDQHPLEA